MKKILIMLVLSLSIGKSFSQDLPTGMTVFGVQQLVNGTIDKLKTAGTTLLGNGQITMLSASNDLSVLMSQLNNMAQNNINKPIQELSFEIKNLAAKVYSATTRINLMVEQQQACLILNASVIIAGVQNVTSELKSGVPLVSSDAPRLNFYQFDGTTPSIVPEQGGRINIIGFRLWEKEKTPPIVSIFDQPRNSKMANITPQRGQNNNSFSFTFTKDFVTKYAGQCLQLKVISRTKNFWGSVKELGEYWLPICISENFGKQIFVKAFVQFPCSVTKTEITTESRDFNFDNHSCTERKNLDETKCWTLPANAQILKLIHNPEARNDNNVAVNFIGNCVKVTGWIDEATCTEVGFVKKKHHHAYWRTSVKAEYSYPTTETQNSGIITSSKLKLSSSDITILTDLPKTCDSKTENLYWFEVYQFNGKEEKLLYKSPNVSTLSSLDNKGGLIIESNYNPSVSNGKAQLSVKLTFPKCGLQ
jgi:hypothetical protein